MYYQYFGLTEAPFSIAVNPRYLFMSARHRDALAHLLYGVGAGGGGRRGVLVLGCVWGWAWVCVARVGRSCSCAGCAAESCTRVRGAVRDVGACSHSTSRQCSLPQLVCV